jgi:hypothetical protein
MTRRKAAAAPNIGGIGGPFKENRSPALSRCGRATRVMLRLFVAIRPPIAIRERLLAADGRGRRRALAERRAAPPHLALHRRGRPPLGARRRRRARRRPPSPLRDRPRRNRRVRPARRAGRLVGRPGAAGAAQDPPQQDRPGDRPRRPRAGAPRLHPHITLARLPRGAGPVGAARDLRRPRPARPSRSTRILPVRKPPRRPTGRSTPALERYSLA